MTNIDQTPKEGKAYVKRKYFVLPAMLTSENKRWFKIFKAAMLELDSQKLPNASLQRREAVKLRLKEIEADSDHQAERQQIDDALSSLRMLEREK